MFLRTCFFILAALVPSFAFAHGSHGSGIMAGFTHPILGTDHAIAILGTGFLGFLIKRSKSYLVFAPFIIAMIVGGFLGINQEATYLLEKAIAASVLIIGVFILIHKKINFNIILVSLAVFGFLHGFAHGAEMPQSMNSLIYISGFSLGALLMAVIGSLICIATKVISNFNRTIHVISGIVIGCGIMILL